MRDVRCARCGRLLAKIDSDGLLHVKLGKDGPQMLVDVTASKVMTICPSVVYSSNGKVSCGERTFISHEELEAQERNKCLID